MISAAFPYQKQRRQVLGTEMAYVEVGAGDPIVLLHGNPTSSFLWRNVLPYLQPLGRCIAPDLIGMGDSDKLPDSSPGSYRFVEHRRYLDALLEALGVHQRVTLVVHDWGSALGFDWAYRHPDCVRAIAYMEAIVGTMRWDEWTPEERRTLFQRFRSPEGERLILDENAFIEVVLPSGILRRVTPAELEEYRRPFRTPGESRRPMLSWPRQLPIDGEPRDVCDEVERYAGWLATCDVPKLFINAEPGNRLIGPRLRETCRRWPNQREVTVRGLHFLQEDSPNEIARAIGEFLTALPDMRGRTLDEGVSRTAGS